ncbi:hypothetical protein LY78DRAFT_659187 [Colletotrichum sublineola]|nr:hypothetical protein LY78DRAFT_659187 [Colletotrichum sublineola]
MPVTFLHATLLGACARARAGAADTHRESAFPELYVARNRRILPDRRGPCQSCRRAEPTSHSTSLDWSLPHGRFRLGPQQLGVLQQAVGRFLRSLPASLLRGTSLDKARPYRCDARYTTALGSLNAREKTAVTRSGRPREAGACYEAAEASKTTKQRGFSRRLKASVAHRRRLLSSTWAHSSQTNQKWRLSGMERNGLYVPWLGTVQKRHNWGGGGGRGDDVGGLSYFPPPLTRLSHIL